MKGSLIVALIFAAGVLIGIYVAPIQSFIPAELSEWLLYALVIQTGLALGAEGNWRKIKESLSAIHTSSGGHNSRYSTVFGNSRCESRRVEHQRLSRRWERPRILLTFLGAHSRDKKRGHRNGGRYQTQYARLDGEHRQGDNSSYRRTLVCESIRKIRTHSSRRRHLNGCEPSHDCTHLGPRDASYSNNARSGA